MSYEYVRQQMVENQLRSRGIKDERLLGAMEQVERHLFVPDYLRDRAYEDCALPIGEGQTISQPYMVAIMTELLELKGDEKVLEVGTGSGYQAAVLSKLASQVYSVERISALAARAEALLKNNLFTNVHLFVADGTVGLLNEAPFDAIIVTAGAPKIPEQYVEQLKDNGRLVIPVGTRFSQVLHKITKAPSGSRETLSTACVFVPLIGSDGWEDEYGH